MKVAIAILLISCYTRVENYQPCHVGPHKYALVHIQDTVILRGHRDRFARMEVHQCVKYCCSWRDTFYLYKDLMVKR